MLVRIAFDELDPRLLPDMGVNVAFLEAEVPNEQDQSNATRLWIPSAAVRRTADATVVFVVSGETTERRAVTLGGQDGDDVEITAGVRENERVVVNAPAELVGGEPVTIADSPQ